MGLVVQNCSGIVTCPDNKELANRDRKNHLYLI